MGWLQVAFRCGPSHHHPRSSRLERAAPSRPTCVHAQGPSSPGSPLLPDMWELFLVLYVLAALFLNNSPSVRAPSNIHLYADVAAV